MGKLILCGTPIGNLEDMSPRAVRALEEADVIACEDTRRTRKLLSHFGISARSMSVYNEGNRCGDARSFRPRIPAGEGVRR
jgi:16S rRNA (cytidine1402-2'-O)-methyltransferase